MKFKFIGGNLTLDFINTVGDRLADVRKEYFGGFEDFMVWSVAAGVVKSSEAKHLLKVGSDNPAQAKKILKKAIKLREILFEILVAMAMGKKYPPALLAEFNGFLTEAFKNLQIGAANQRLAWKWNNAKNNPEEILWSVTWSAANLLINEDLKFLKLCADDGCGWLFLDTSKNKKRAWCDMKDCGNRNKLRRYYSRTKAETK